MALAARTTVKMTDFFFFQNDVKITPNMLK